MADAILNSNSVLLLSECPYYIPLKDRELLGVCPPTIFLGRVRNVQEVDILLLFDVADLKNLLLGLGEALKQVSNYAYF